MKMSNLSGYYNQIKFFEQQINEKQKKLIVYEEALNIINKISSGLPAVENNLSEALNNCLSGAFYIGECLPSNTYGNGAIYDCKNKITDVIGRLNTLKSECNIKISSTQREITKLETAYKNAKDSYNEELRKNNSKI